MPGAVTADRGYGQAAVDRHLLALSVRNVAIRRQAGVPQLTGVLGYIRG